MNITTTILEIDTPSIPSGMIYPRNEVEKMIKEFEDSRHNDISHFSALDDNRTTFPITNMTKIALETLELKLVDNKLEATIHILSTPMGNILSDLFERDIDVDFSLLCAAVFTDDVANDMRFYGVSVKC